MTCCGITGSPFSVKISGEGRVKESITRTRRAPSVATVGSICDLNLKIPGKQQHPYPQNHNLHLCSMVYLKQGKCELQFCKDSLILT